MEGTWINSCSCDSGCPCLFYADPTKGYCKSMDGFHISKGKYGNVDLDGLNVVVAGHAPGNFWKGNWSAAVYFDQRAKEEQRKALETVFGGKAGGVPAVLASLIKTVKGTKYVPIRFNTREVHVHIPRVLEYQLKPTQGGDKTKPITVGNHPMSPSIDAMKMGIATKSWHRGFGLDFDNKGKDGNWAEFDFKGP
jgi:hypothetical protein